MRDHNLALDLNSTFSSLHEAVQQTSELLIQIPESLNQNGIIKPEVASRYVLTQSDIEFFYINIVYQVIFYHFDLLAWFIFLERERAVFYFVIIRDCS